MSSKFPPYTTYYPLLLPPPPLMTLVNVCRFLRLKKEGEGEKRKVAVEVVPVSYTHLTLPTTPYV